MVINPEGDTGALCDVTIDLQNVETTSCKVEEAADGVQCGALRCGVCCWPVTAGGKRFAEDLHTAAII